MTPDVRTQLGQRIAAADLRLDPYPHIFVENVFPADYYAELQRNIPAPDAMLRFEEVRRVRGYEQRFALDIQGPMESVADAQRQFWSGLTATLVRSEFIGHLLLQFGPFLQQRFQGQAVRLFDEAYLVQDTTQYALGPHTDAPSKVITVVFYLPQDRSQEHLGTSIYRPKDPSFRCRGGPHYPFEPFERVASMPFLPNALFAFVKSDHSFHGVEPVLDPNVRRWLLLYDIKLHPDPAPAGASA